MLGELKTTDRGFERIEFRDCYQNVCSLQQSSITRGDRKPGHTAVWLGAGDDRMHLDRGQVIDLIQHLQTWLDFNTFLPPTEPTLEEQLVHAVLNPPPVSTVTGGASPYSGQPVGWRHEHPDADVPPWFDEHCTDHSWHNDTMPIFHYGEKLAVFVDYADPEKSEDAQWRLDGQAKRFRVIAINPPDALNTYGDKVMYETDDLESLKYWLKNNTPETTDVHDDNA